MRMAISRTSCSHTRRSSGRSSSSSFYQSRIRCVYLFPTCFHAVLKSHFLFFSVRGHVGWKRKRVAGGEAGITRDSGTPHVTGNSRPWVIQISFGSMKGMFQVEKVTRLPESERESSADQRRRPISHASRSAKQRHLFHLPRQVQHPRPAAHSSDRNLA